MARPFGLSRRELAAWTALVLGAPLLVWVFRPGYRSVDTVQMVRPESGTPETVQVRLDLNRASAEELQLVPGIGPQRARQIVVFRKQHGRFRSVQDLAELPGFSAALLERIAPMLAVPTATSAEQ